MTGYQTSPTRTTVGQRPRERTDRVALDAIDLEILRQLQNDGRISKSALAELVNLSTSACLERMRALEKKKLIMSYHARINVKLIAHHEVFFTEVSLKSHRLYDFDRFERFIQSLDAVAECYALGGGIDYLLKIVAADIGEYQQLLEAMLEAEIGIEKYFTYVCTKPVKGISRIPLQAVLAEA